MDIEVQFSIEEAADFLACAHLALDANLISPAISNAVHSAIRAKDAICLQEKGFSASTRRHADAVAELRRIPVLPSTNIRQFAQLIDAKPRAEYQFVRHSKADAQRYVLLSGRFFEAIEKLLQT